jgi:hypothetical protein
MPILSSRSSRPWDSFSRRIASRILSAAERLAQGVRVYQA